ncbi:MAG: diacylglycerol kinase family protein [Candidatus Velthaea sp.]
MQATLLVNTNSRRAHRQVTRIGALLEAGGVNVTDFEILDDGDKVAKRVRRAVKRGATHIIIGGGDGTMTKAVDELAHREVVMGVLPLGTGNSFAQTLGIGHDIESAVRTIAGGRVARVDLGVVNGRHFANFATIGLPAVISEATPHALKGIIGPAAYGVAGIAPLFTSTRFTATIRSDGGTLKFSTRHVVIASGRYFGNQPVVPEASITDGKLALFTTTGTSAFAVMRAYAAFGFGRQTTLADAHSFQSSEILVRAKPKQLVSIDGDAFGTTPACFSVARRALRVLVPDTFDDADG